ncbi:MAG: S8 family serine peptidase [Pseudomonadota bacterium]
MAAIRLFLSLVLLAATIPASAQPAFTVQPGTSGAWFDPAKDGQGFIFQVIDARTALTVWYTFDPQGNQAYLVGVGEIQGNRVVMTNLTRTRGGRWGAAFNATQVVREDWGDITFTFANCDRATVVYSPGSSGWPADTLNLQRLTAPRGVGCSNAAPADAPKFLQGAITGAWFDPARDGEGWLVEVISPDLAVAYWFTYTPDGRQAWIGGLGRIVNGSIIVDEATQPIGGRFGPAFNPAQVQRRPWGAFALTVSGCRTAVASSFGPSDYPPFQYANVQQLTSIAGTQPCAFTVGSFALSGSGRALPNTAIDGDVNNPEVANRDNDTPVQVQALPSPVVVSGYATARATGRTGDRFAASTDVFDAYRLNLAQGQALTLAVSDWNPGAQTSVDLDLLLYRAGDPSTPVASALGTGPTEVINVGQSGSYDVVVTAVAGASNYVLSTATSAPRALTGAMALEYAMRADEVVVDFDAPPGDPVPPERRAAGLGMKARGGGGGMPALLQVTDRSKALGRLAKSPDPLAAAGWGLSVAARAHWDTIRIVKGLRARPDVLASDPNYEMALRSVRTPNDPGYPFQWHYDQINLPQAWNLATGSRNVVAAVIDSGVGNLLSGSPHPDIVGNIDYSLGWNFARPGLAAGNDGSDPSFHGTHVAGTVAADGNNATGVTGVNWQATIMPIVYGSAGSFGFIQGPLRWAAGLTPNGTPTQPTRRAAVANLSYGSDFRPCSQTEQQAVSAARQAGLIMVVASGNNNTFLPGSPDSCEGVVNVSAVNRQGVLAFYSNCGPTIDVAAPGGEIGQPFELPDRDEFPQFANARCQATPGRVSRVEDQVASTVFRGPNGGPFEPTYGFLQGTSMAAPHVTGVVALMKAIAPGMTPDQFDQLLAAGRLTRDLANNGANERDDAYGYGLIDAYKAVLEARALAGAAAAPAVVLAAPTSFTFAIADNSQRLVLSAGGGGAVQVSAVTDDAPWLNVVAIGTNAQGLGNYDLVVSRAGLPAADYRATVTVQAGAAGTLRIPVSLRVGQDSVPGDAGTVYALALDLATLVPVGEASTNAANGYRYSIGNRFPGAYALLIGSDNDNDGQICDEGENCGIYPSIGEPQPVLVGNAPISLGITLIEPDLSGLGASPTGSAPVASANLRAIAPGAVAAAGVRDRLVRRSASAAD